VINRLKILQANKGQFSDGGKLFDACKSDSTLQNEITYLSKVFLRRTVSGCSNCYMDAYLELVNLNIEKAMKIVKENPFISSIRVSSLSTVEYLNENDEDVKDWRVDVEEWIVYGDGFYFYCQNKWDSSDQLESEHINLEQFKN